MSDYITIRPDTTLSEQNSTISSVIAEINPKAWNRYIKIGIFEVNYNAKDGKVISDELTGIAYEFDGENLDISFSITVSQDSNQSVPTATVTLKNLNSDTQWRIKKFMRLTINAGYVGDKNNGLVFGGQITNIVDTYEDDGSITLKLSCLSLYQYISTLVQTPKFPADTPYSTIINYVCNAAQVPITGCEIDSTYTLKRAQSYCGTAEKILTEIITDCNNLLVQNKILTASEVNSGNGFTINNDRQYVEIVYRGGERAYAIAFNGNNGLISVNRGDILSNNTMSSGEIVTVDAEVQFNWRVRLNSAIYIQSVRQPHLDGVYRVYSYDMTGNSRSGNHSVTMSMYPVQGFAKSLVDLSKMYSLSAEAPKSE